MLEVKLIHFIEQLKMIDYQVQMSIIVMKTEIDNGTAYLGCRQDIA